MDGWIGFEVVGDGAVLGRVEAVRWGGRPRRPLALVVRDGDTLALLPTGRVVEVRPRARRLVVATAPPLRRARGRPGRPRRTPG